MKTSKLAVISVLLLAVTGMASPAQAVTLATHDSAGDVRHAMDIHRVTVRNGQRLVITMKHRAIMERNGAWSAAYIDVTPGSGGGAPNYYIVGGVGTHYDFYSMDGWRIGGRLGCVGGGYTHSYDFAADTTRFSLARGCLNGANFRATRVRVSAIAGENLSARDWAPGYRRFSAWVGQN